MSLFDLFGQGRRAGKDYRRRFQYEKSRLEGIQEQEGRQVSSEQRMARQVHSKRLASMEASMATGGAVMDTGSTRQVLQAQIKAQHQQEANAMSDWFDRQATLLNATNMAEHQAKLGAYNAKQQAKANMIGLLSSGAMMAIGFPMAGAEGVTGALGTGLSTAGTGGFIGGIGNIFGDLEVSPIGVDAGQRRAGFEQWLAGGF